MRDVGFFSGWLRRVLCGLLVAMVRFYQAGLRLLLGAGHCRYLPTCSEYFVESVRQRGPLVGALAGLWRICRCHPLAKGGYDPVPGGSSCMGPTEKD